MTARPHESGSARMFDRSIIKMIPPRGPDDDEGRGRRRRAAVIRELDE